MNPRRTRRWTFLTNHAHVLLCLRADPAARALDVARRVRITERAARRIIRDLERERYLVIRKDGRRNRYTINGGKPLRHPAFGRHRIAALLRLAGRARGRD